SVGKKQLTPLNARVAIPDEEVTALKEKYGFKDARQLRSGLASVRSALRDARMMAQMQHSRRVASARRRLERALSSLEAAFNDTPVALIFLKLRIQEEAIDLLNWRLALGAIRQACRAPFSVELTRDVERPQYREDDGRDGAIHSLAFIYS